LNDEELLLKYKKYVKKRNLIIIISLLFVLVVAGCIFFYISRLSNETIQLPKQEEPVLELEDKAPILELTEKEIIIEINNEIDYISYIKTAIDEVDGDLKEKVQYSKIDNSKIGEYKILYYVFDSSNNVSQAFLKVIIEEPPTEIEPENSEEPIVSPPKIENDNNLSKEEKEESKPEQNTSAPSQKPSTKYFLFKDGYTINNVVDACAKELKSYGGSGRCEPITDENGIYLGMKLLYEWNEVKQLKYQNY